jgi:hypothetical protein
MPRYETPPGDIRKKPSEEASKDESFSTIPEKVKQENVYGI